MGKIRVKTFGDEELEQKEKEEAKRKKEAKIAEKRSSETKSPKEPESKEEVKEDTEVSKDTAQTEGQAEIKKEKAEKKEPKKTTKNGKQFHSQKYLGLAQTFDKAKSYTLSEALDLLETLQRKTTDETVELHINTPSGGISGSVVLPHGTGKSVRVAIASDDLIAEIEKGKISFDILLAEPAMMVKLARVAKVLGPRGLMPNPKNGTITQNPQEAAKKYEGGQVNFKTEKAPIIHLTAGKMSFGKEKLSQNINALITAVKKSNIVNVTLKSTMSPGIKIKI